MEQFINKILMAGLLSLASATSFAADYYVVVPVKGKTVNAADIQVALQAAALPAGMVGRAYSYDLKQNLFVTGDPALDLTRATWSASSALPAGFSLGADGVVVGTPSVINETGTSFSVTADYKAKTSTQTYTLMVNGTALEVLQVSKGYTHSCAITAVGGVKCWGENNYGQLGDGTLVSRYRPVSVTGLSSGFVRVEVGYYHTCAANSAGQLYCWGSNDYGQVGNGTAAPAVKTPTLVSALTQVQDFALGNGSACAIASEGLKCWGLNNTGKLGDGTYTTRAVPTAVQGIPTAIDVAVSQAHACAVLQGGALKCWGQDAYGELGYTAANANQPLPIQVEGLTSGVVAVDTTYATTCVVMTGGGAKCWGFNGSGQVGNGTNAHQGAPVDVKNLTSFSVAKIKTGFSHTCVLSTAGAVKCWGGGTATGVGATWLPLDVTFFPSGVADIAMGGDGSCVKTYSGVAKCWGNNGSGQLGDGTSQSRSSPVTVLP